MSKETEIENFQENWRRTKEYVDNHSSIDPTVLDGLAKNTTSHAILNHLHADGNDNDVPTSVMAESSTGERLCFDYAGAKLGLPMVYYWECASFYDGMTATSESYAIGSTINVVLGESVIGYVIKSVSKHKVATESEPGIIEDKASNAATYAQQVAQNTSNLNDFIDNMGASVGSDSPDEGKTPLTLHNKIDAIASAIAGWITDRWTKFIGEWDALKDNLATKTDIPTTTDIANAVGEKLPTDYAKSSDIPTDYATATKLSELTTKCDGIDAKIGYAINEIDAL